MLALSSPVFGAPRSNARGVSGRIAFTQAVQANPRFSALYADLAASLARAGRIDESKLIARRLLELEPGFRIQPVVAILGGFANPEDVNEFAAGLRQAGLPE